MRRTFVILFLTFLLSSCGNNQIYYDAQSEAIISCYGNTIRNIRINCKENHEYYAFMIKDENEGRDTFYLYKINPGFKLSTMGAIRPVTDFRILPNAKYVINNGSLGDHAAIEIEIETDENGKVKSASKTTCRNW